MLKETITQDQKENYSGVGLKVFCQISQFYVSYYLLFEKAKLNFS